MKSFFKVHTNFSRNATFARYEKVWFKRRFLFEKKTFYSAKRELCIKCQANEDKLNAVVYNYWNIAHTKLTKLLQLRKTEYQKRLSKRIYLLSFIDVFYKRYILLDGTTNRLWNRFRRKGVFSVLWSFTDGTGDLNWSFLSIVFGKLCF